ncbi:MAG TPA: YihY/virulence factor BrkB family protein [Steroidobacteraceae bacterium]|jgi:membrane protein|nr:YihY/virulence factor BrkB family protein [Steroidobacteraceae bacterium]
MIPTLLGNLERWLFEPPESIYGRPLWKLTRILRYPYALIRDILRGDLTLRGMSLVYTTLLSVVPLIAVMFSVLKGLGYHRELEPVLYTFLEPLGERGYQLTSQIMTFVDNVRGDVLGAVGVIFLLYTTLSMIQKVEEAFNFVWRVAQPRSLMRRVSEYLSVMVIGPAVIVAAFGLIASFAHSSGAQAVAKYEPVGTVLAVFGRLTPYVLVTGVFTFLYGFMPNTKVRFRAALIGGVFAGVVWAATGMIFTSFVITSTRNIVIYASFAIVIVALIWLHVSWLILLLGAQLSFYVQNPQYLRPGPGEIQLNASLRERVALSIMYLIVSDYRSADHRWNTNRLAEHLELPGAGINPILNALERAKLLLAAEDETWVPGRDPQAIELIEVLEAVRHDAAGPRLARIRDIAPAVAAARAAEEAMRKSLKGRTLNDLVEQESAKSQAKA